MIENQIINKAIDYIFQHIDEDLSVESIAAFCGYSKFYLNRLFKAETGEGIYAFIKRAKIEESAWRLKVEQKRSITEIAGDYGYSASNFATMFRDYFEKSPAQFRHEIVGKSVSHPFFHGKENKLETFDECCKKISVENLPDYFVLYERHKENYHSLEKDWCEFMEHYRDFITSQTVLIERTVNDPSITNPDECLYEVCMTIDPNDPRLEVQKTVAAGITSRAGTSTAPNTMVLKFGKFSWNKEEIAKTFLNGSSEFIGELAGCISMYCYNFVLLKYSGQDGVPVFLLQGFNMIGSMYFTSCGMAKKSAIISSARGIVILLITIFVFSALWGLNGIWLSAPATEAFTVGITLHFIGRKLHLV